MEYIEAAGVYADLEVKLRYAETLGKTKIEAIEEFAREHGTEKVKTCVETLCANLDEKKDSYRQILNIVKRVNGGAENVGTLLSLLVVTVNQNIRECKARLEVEEKTREVAVLQGKLAGYRTLINFLRGEFGLSEVTVEDSGESAPDLELEDAPYINMLASELESLETDYRWEKLLERVSQKTEEFKNYLMFVAENARDLYITQANRDAIACYNELFDVIRREKEYREKRLKEELDFGGDAESDGGNDTEDGEPEAEASGDAESEEADGNGEPPEADEDAEAASLRIVTKNGMTIIGDPRDAFPSLPLTGDVVKADADEVEGPDYV